MTSAPFGFASPVAFAALGGETADGEPIAIITQENPELVPAMAGGRVSKEVLERLHLERYRQDYLARHRVVPFEEVRTGRNPPDFVVQLADGSRENLDCVAWGWTGRRLSYRLFRQLRDKLLASADVRDFSGVRDCVLTIWFGGGNELPPKRDDQTIASALTDLIAGFHADREAIAALTAGGIPPKQIPDGLLIASTAGEEAGFSVTPVQPGQLQTDFARALGFDCAPHMGQEVTRAQAASELQRLISQHDQPAIDHLVVTVGGPDRDGYRYPAEDVPLALVESGSLRWERLRRVTIHRWSDGTCFEIANAADAVVL